MTNERLIIESTIIIEKNISKPLTVYDLANRIGYSLYHFIRLFNAVVGYSPGEYQTLRRISRAASDLIDQNRRITDIAYDYQFSSPEAFSRTFKRITGLSPSNFRRQYIYTDKKNSIPCSKPFYQDYIYPRFIDSNYVPEKVYMEKMLVAGRLVTVKNDYSPIALLWKEFMELPVPENAIKPVKYIQYSFWDELNNNILYIMASLLVSKIGNHDSLVYKKIPSACYLSFPHYGNGKEIKKTYNNIYSKWLPGSNFKLNIPFNIEIYPEMDNNISTDPVAWILLPLKYYEN